MGRHLGLESAAIANTLDNPRHERRAVEHAHFPGHADVCIHERIVVRDHVLVGRLGRDRVFEGVCGALEEETPEGPVDEVEEGEDAERSVRR